MSDTQKRIKEAWDTLSEQLVLVLGTEAALKPYGQLAGPGGFERYPAGQHGRDPFRITMGVFKDRCDKARLKNPELTLMRSWDKAAHLTDEQIREEELEALHRGYAEEATRRYHESRA